MKDNRGFSLIELIVVIAIMGIASGIVAYVLVNMSSARAKTAAEDLKAELETTRVLAMSRGGGKMKLYRDANGDIWAERVITNDVTDGSESGDKKKIGTSAITITYHVKDSADYDITNDPCEFTFHPGTGEFTGSRFIDSITVSGGGKTVKLILWKLTGRVETE